MHIPSINHLTFKQCIDLKINLLPHIFKMKLILTISIKALVLHPFKSGLEH
eukprot:c36981_g1_i1 orf=3-152(-)